MEYVWYGVVIASILAYVLLDGYDLGIGIISLFEKNKATRFEQLDEVANVWDGNETWLVMAGVSIWAGFPLAFGVLLPHLYIPLILMLFGLVFRGFSIEMISQRDGHVGERWYWFFGGGSLVVAFMQGCALGSLSVPAEHNGLDYVSAGVFSAFSWYSLLLGVGVVVLYVTFGYAYLHMHGVGNHEVVATRGAIGVVAAGILAIVAIALVGLTPAGIDFSSPMRQWSFAGAMIFAVAGLGLALFSFLSRSTDNEVSGWPLAGMAIAGVAVFAAFLATHAPGLAAGLTVSEAASPETAFDFLLVGIGLNVPLIFFYTWYAQRVLGKRRVAATVRVREA